MTTSTGFLKLILLFEMNFKVLSSVKNIVCKWTRGMLQIIVSNRPTRGAGIGCHSNVKSKTDLSKTGLLRKSQKKCLATGYNSHGFAPIARNEDYQTFVYFLKCVNVYGTGNPLLFFKLKEILLLLLLFIVAWNGSWIISLVKYS